MRISDYLDPRLVLFIKQDSRDATIDAMIDLLDKEGKLKDKKSFREAIFYREGLVSTGIGMGIAIPHAKLSSIDEFFIAIGISQDKGIEWGALDNAPVRFVFMIGGPDSKQTEYLQILSLLTSSIKEVDLRKKMLKAANSAEVFELFSNSF